MHQDAHEFLNYLINRVVEDLEQEDKLGREEREREREREKQSRASTSDGPREDCESFFWVKEKILILIFGQCLLL
jgi:hypothetical protein